MFEVEPCCTMYQHFIPLWLNNAPLNGHTTFYSSVVIWVLSTCWVLWIVLLWTLMYKFFFEYLFFSSLEYVASSGIDGSVDKIMCFNFLRDCPTVFHSNCTILHLYQQWMRVPVVFFSHSLQHLSEGLLGVWGIDYLGKWIPYLGTYGIFSSMLSPKLCSPALP